MIVLDNECSPRWLRELALFLPLKNLIFVQGNVLDLLAYPIRFQSTKGGSIEWTENAIPLFFRRFLEELQYGVVGFFDPVDGLSFANKEMEETYKQLSSGRCSAPAAPYRTSTVESRLSAGASETLTASPTPERTIAENPTELDKDLNRVLDGIRDALRNTSVPCVFVFNLASRLLSSPDRLSREERILFTKVLKACNESADVYKDGLQWKNVMIFICDKLNDLPAFLYLNNPRARSVHIDKPDSLARSLLFRRSYPNFFGVETGSECSADIVSHFSALTDGMSNCEIKNLVSLSRREKFSITKSKDVQKLCERYKYGITTSEWEKIDRFRLDKSGEKFRERIKGQDMAIARVLDIIKRAKIGLAAGASGGSSRPRGVLFFAGPTGVGKTELAKSLAQQIFGDQDRCIRFDMSEYSSQHADQRLLGAPPGYVGYEEGGQLTTAIREKPFSILLFDEIEKAHQSIFDKFLQILDDGRLTDGKGETVYFSESIIIFTSNLGTVSKEPTKAKDEGHICPYINQRPNIPESKNSTNAEDEGIDQSKLPPYDKMQERVLKAIRDHFNFELGRPEILNRFGDNFVVFDFIRPPVDEQIIDLLLENLKESALESHKITLTIENSVRETLISLGRLNLQHGGRGLRNVIDSALVNPLNRVLFDCGIIKEGKEGIIVRVKELLDHGIGAIYRFELTIEHNIDHACMEHES